MRYRARAVKHKIRIYANTNYFHTPTYNFMRRGYNAKHHDWSGLYAFYVFYVAACGGGSASELIRFSEGLYNNIFFFFTEQASKNG